MIRMRLDRWEAISTFDRSCYSVPRRADGRWSVDTRLAAAGTNAGGLGFVAAGYLSADVLAERIVAARNLTSGPLGANLFVPQPSAAHRRRSSAMPRRWRRTPIVTGLQLGDPVSTMTTGRPRSTCCSTCGRTWHRSPSACRAPRSAGGCATRHHGRGTVTLAEAPTAVDRGVDAIAVQGPSAGGHRGTFDPSAQPDTTAQRTARRRVGGSTSRSSPPVG